MLAAGMLFFYNPTTQLLGCDYKSETYTDIKITNKQLKVTDDNSAAFFQH